MKVSTGQTINEVVASLDPQNNNPIVPTTFTSSVYYNGVELSGASVIFTILDTSKGLYNAAWTTGDQYGDYQMYAKNDNTNVVYISDVFETIPGGGLTTVYVGI